MNFCIFVLFYRFAKTEQKAPKQMLAIYLKKTWAWVVWKQNAFFFVLFYVMQSNVMEDLLLLREEMKKYKGLCRSYWYCNSTFIY